MLGTSLATIGCETFEYRKYICIYFVFVRALVASTILIDKAVARTAILEADTAPHRSKETMVAKEDMALRRNKEIMVAEIKVAGINLDKEIVSRTKETGSSRDKVTAVETKEIGDINKEAALAKIKVAGHRRKETVFRIKVATGGHKGTALTKINLVASQDNSNREIVAKIKAAGHNRSKGTTTAKANATGDKVNKIGTRKVAAEVAAAAAVAVVVATGGINKAVAAATGTRRTKATGDKTRAREAVAALGAEMTTATADGRSRTILATTLKTIAAMVLVTTQTSSGSSSNPTG